MYLASFLNNIFKNNGFILVDANLKKYIIGFPKKKMEIVKPRIFTFLGGEHCTDARASIHFKRKESPAQRARANRFC